MLLYPLMKGTLGARDVHFLAFDALHCINTILLEAQLCLQGTFFKCAGSVGGVTVQK